MSKHIVVGLDPRTSDAAPVRFGVAMVRLTGAPLVVAAVEAHTPVRAGDEDLLGDVREVLGDMQRRLEAEGVAVDCRRLASTSAARALQELAESVDAGLLVVGSARGGAPGRLLPGSTARRLLHGAPCPLTVVPQRWSGGLGTIAVAYVDNREGREALHAAHALARLAGARLRVVTVVKPTIGMYQETEPYVPPVPGKDVTQVEGEHRVAAERELRDVVASLGDEVPVEVDAFVGDVADVLADFSSHVDVLVCGSRAYGPVRSVLLGSVSARIVEHANCPVLVVPRGVEGSLDALLAAEPAAEERARTAAA
jgi:nucleotide-binding universal stress UspA family protein